MVVLIESHPRFADHDTGRFHPERPARLQAVLDGVAASPVAEAVALVAPRRATQAEMARVHGPAYLDALERFCAGGGGRIDADTSAGPGSWDAAVLAAGAGLDAVERMTRGEADAAFCVVRPPGHHATPATPMGFCLINNIAVTAAALAEQGERVLIVDWDAHHGNGTQAAFYDAARVAYVSMHQYPFYPGTGALSETGEGAGAGTTLNLPFPAGTTGEAYLAAVDEVLVPFVERFQPTWILVSAGFDGHRADPLTDMGLSAGDYAELTVRIMDLCPPGRRLAFLEGGYDLEALALSAGACVAALAGEITHPEPLTSGGGERARQVVEAVRNTAFED